MDAPERIHENGTAWAPLTPGTSSFFYQYSLWYRCFETIDHTSDRIVSGVFIIYTIWADQVYSHREFTRFINHITTTVSDISRFQWSDIQTRNAVCISTVTNSIIK